MLDLTWKVFSQTGNIETYLLLKEMENVDDDVESERTGEKLTNTNEETLQGY